jgi:peroxiredoxin
MALTETTKIPLGSKAPDFSLPDAVSGRIMSLDDLMGKNGTLVMFICNHCPFVVHIRSKLVELAEKYKEKGIQFIAISSNDADNYPADAPEFMKELALSMSFPFPYLYDESQVVAKAYNAACTPDFSLFDSDSKCVYRGRLDGSTPGNGVPLTGVDLTAALDAMLRGQPNLVNQLPSVGCNIKWKK